MNVQVNPNEDTEWNDILRAHGVIPEKPPSPSAQIEEALEQAIEHARDHRLDDKTLDELDELEDEEDEEFLESYRQKRMAELQTMKSKQKYGSLMTISKPEYTDEITNASKDNTYVLLHISYVGVEECKLLTALFERTAVKFPEVKFVQIDARQINEKYPSTNCPTILVYKNTDVAKQYVTLAQLGGRSTNLSDIENMLVSIGAVNVKDRRLLANKDDDEDGGSRGLRSSVQDDDSYDSDFE